MVLTLGALIFQRVAAGQNAAYRLDNVAGGVYLAVPISAPTGANIPLIVSDQDAIMVGTHLSPASARALIEQVKTVTDKPVRFIINTHYHAPQASSPREAFPSGVEVIGHELARRAILFDAERASSMATARRARGERSSCEMSRSRRRSAVSRVSMRPAMRDLRQGLPLQPSE